MKKIFYILLFISGGLLCQTQRVSVTMLLPSYSQAQANSFTTTIPSGELYLQIWNSTTQTIQYWTGTQLQDLPAVSTPPLILGTPTSGNLTNCTFPTLNQNTSGTAAGLSANITESQVTNLVSDLALKANLISPVLVTPNVGVASGTSFAATGAITSSGTAGIGYAVGAGSVITQATNKTTGVTLNKTCGAITTNAAALAAAAEVAFTLTNSTIGIDDIVVVSIKSGGTAGAYFTSVGATAAGSCSITLGNCSAGSLSQAVVISFAVIKGQTN